ncbi:MAG: hydantoinase/oxoprolinase family protein [Pseudomonadota bacterium]
MSGKIIGVDVGGTFTDVFVWNEDTGAVSTGKVPTTVGDQSKGFVSGIVGQVPDFSAISTIVHGTTTGTNALLERRGARTGIITSQGFRDVLEMRRRDRPQTWGLWGKFDPVVPRNLRIEVAERTHADGMVHTPVDLAQVRGAAEKLRAAGCEAVCIFFINGYANPENERVAAKAVREIWPNGYVTAATEIIPEIREFERVSTSALNAYLQPVVSSYLDRLQSAIGDHGAATDVLIVQSNGGVMSVDTARDMPIRTALSGPAAGVIAAQKIAGAAGFKNIITCDMGGTSFDVALISDGEAALAPQTAIDFGMVIRSPMIEITTIGAGGGSIAHVDAGGLLQIGPESAGSDPGPVCYGLGNDRPTVTDANLVLGRINPDRPIGGKLARLDALAARTAIEVHVAGPLGLDPLDAAEAILKVANAKMAGAIRLVSIERGLDPAKFAAMPFGGGGALHTGALMQEVGLSAAIVPRYPGVTSALGCVIADMRHDHVQTVNQMLADLDCSALMERITEVWTAGEARLAQSGVRFDRVQCGLALDMLYLGQTHTVSVTLDAAPGLTRERIETAFEQAYLAAYGRLLDGIPMRVMNFRASATGERPHFDMSVFAPPQHGTIHDAQISSRTVRCNGEDHTAPVFDRLALPVNASISGPALLEQSDTTIFIDPGLTGSVDAFGNLVIRKEENGERL